MFKALFNVLFSVISGLANVILAPVNLLVAGLVPDTARLINTFTTAVNTFIGDGLNYFFSMLPPNCKTFILLYLTFLVAYYSISISVHAILKVYKIIQNIKIW